MKVICDENGTFRIPKKIMEKMNIKPGNKLRVTLEGLEDDVLVVQKEND